MGDTFDASAQAAQEYTKSEGMTFIDPFDDYNVQAGQGTVAYEIYEQAQEEGVSFDSILVPIGGGGLISGVATYIKDVAPSMEVIGVEASGARSMRAAFDRGYPVKLEEIDKFADGIAVQKVGVKTYEVARKYVDRLLGVDEGLISETLIDMYSKVGTIAEPAGAASVAALEVIKDEIKGKTIVCIISGGNNDINRMPEMEERALIYDGIKHYFVVNFPQRPGALREFVNDIAWVKGRKTLEKSIIVVLITKSYTNENRTFSFISTFDVLKTSDIIIWSQVISTFTVTKHYTICLSEDRFRQ